MTEPVEPGFAPSAPTLRAAARLERHVRWSSGFWLAYVFTPSPPQAHLLQARVEQALGARGRDQRVLRPATAAELEGILASILEGREVGCTWVEAVRGAKSPGSADAWADAWTRLVLRANERRELLRSGLQGGLVLVAHPDRKADIRRAGPDLWSVRNFVFELPAGPATGEETRGAERTGARPPSDSLDGVDRAAFVDEALLAEDVERLPVALADEPELPAQGRAQTTERLAERVSAAGDHEAAARWLQEVIELYRSFAADKPGAFTHELARALSRYGIELSTLGRHEQAHAVTQEAVDLYRSLVAEQPDAYTPDLAQALNNLGNRLADLGRPQDALAATQEAVRLGRDLVEHGPTASRSDLARALSNLGHRLAALDRLEDALQATQEAVGFYRVVVDQGADGLEPELASTLSNLGHHLNALGRRDEALEAIRESVDLFGKHARARPGAFDRDLALSLSALGTVCMAAGRPAEGFVAFVEALRVVPESSADLVPQLGEDLRRASQAVGRPVPEDLRSRVARESAEPSPEG